MADPRGFLTTPEREVPARRPVAVRIMDWREVYEPGSTEVTKRQAGRCMDCGVPFCHQGCPLGNLIPEWNDLRWRDEPAAALDRLHLTNNFPEFTGKLCPAPCESACVLAISQPAVTIKRIEEELIETGFERGLVVAHPPERLTGRTVAIVGSGPAGLAAAQQLTRAGHTVVVYERADKIGGLLRYGIPDFKMDKSVLDTRLAQMREEGTRFRPGVTIGEDIGWDALRRRFDAVILATGATVPRELALPGRELRGIHPAMDYLVPANRAVAGEEPADLLDARGKHVVILGGGDTGADCLGTAHRQGAASVTTLAIGVRPADERTAETPWPLDVPLFEIQSAHEEGGERRFLVSTVAFLGDGNGRVRALQIADTEIIDGVRRPRVGSEREIPADLVFLALGFTGPETAGPAAGLGLGVTKRGTLERDEQYASAWPGVFVAGDAGRGQSLIVWAIAEGRSAAAAVDRRLQGETRLPSPVRPGDREMAI